MYVFVGLANLTSEDILLQLLLIPLISTCTCYSCVVGSLLCVVNDLGSKCRDWPPSL